MLLEIVCSGRPVLTLGVSKFGADDADLLVKDAPLGVGNRAGGVLRLDAIVHKSVYRLGEEWTKAALRVQRDGWTNPLPEPRPQRLRCSRGAASTLAFSCAIPRSAYPASTAILTGSRRITPSPAPCPATPIPVQFSTRLSNRPISLVSTPLLRNFQRCGVHCPVARLSGPVTAAFGGTASAGASHRPLTCRAREGGDCDHCPA